MNSIFVRTELKPGDLGAVVELHGILYSAEYGLDPTFEAYVAGPLAEFVISPERERQRIWVVESDGIVMGSVAIVGNSDEEAQLRWFLLHPDFRGRGLGRRLVQAALEFCRQVGYRRVILWTFSELTAAASIYEAFGFVKTEEKTHKIWGRILTEEKYELNL